MPKYIVTVNYVVETETDDQNWNQVWDRVRNGDWSEADVVSVDRLPYYYLEGDTRTFETVEEAFAAATTEAVYHWVDGAHTLVESVTPAQMKRIMQIRGLIAADEAGHGGYRSSRSPQ